MLAMLATFFFKSCFFKRLYWRTKFEASQHFKTLPAQFFALIGKLSSEKIFACFSRTIDRLICIVSYNFIFSTKLLLIIIALFGLFWLRFEIFW